MQSRTHIPPGNLQPCCRRLSAWASTNIAIARKRRGETQGQWEDRLGASQPTMARIERGDPSVAMASYLMCMWLINQAHGLADLVAPLQDHTALEHEVIRVRQKGKRPSAPNQAPVPRAVAGGRQRIAKPAAKKTVGPVAANQHCHGLGQPSTSASVNQ